MRTLLFIVVLTAVGLLAPAVANAGPSELDRHHGPLRQALDRYVATGVPGAVVLVRDGDRTTRLTSGVDRLESNESVRATDRFRVGSITKTYVATVLLQLVGERRVSLEDTVERWLPGRVPNGRNVTVRQLMTHTSGLGDYFQQPGFFDPFFAGDTQHRWTPQDLLAAAVTVPPVFTPGSGWQYSNTGYMLLGHIVRAATGNPIETELQRRIFGPLRLHDTSFDTQPVMAGRHAHGYSRLPSESQALVDVTDWSPSYAWSAGAIVSTADDTATFYDALLTGRVLRPYLLAQMMTTVPMGAPGEDYGLGLWRTRGIALPGRSCRAEPRGDTTATSSATTPTRSSAPTASASWYCSARTPRTSTTRARYRPSSVSSKRRCAEVGATVRVARGSDHAAPGWRGSTV